MSNILITGATGNIGFEVIRFLNKIDSPNRIIAGVRNIDKAKSVFQDYPDLNYTHFDFEDFDTFDNALNGIDTLFLLRPPHISDIENIGEAGAILLDKFDNYKNQALEITGLENENFLKVIEIINSSIKNPIRYKNVNPLSKEKRNSLIDNKLLNLTALKNAPQL